MFYHFLYPLADNIQSFFNVFRYITFRSLLAFLIAGLVSVVWGKYFIKYLKRKQFGQSVRDDGPESHFKKQGTPTLGGVFIIGSVVVAIALCGNFLSTPLMLSMGVMLSFFLLGLIDDYLKVLKKNSDGISGKGKLIWQISTSALVSYIAINSGIIDTKLYFPIFKDLVIDLGWYYIAFATVVIVGASNAVNLTDGLDGLAIGPIITTSVTLGVFAYITGHKELAGYLNVPFFSGTGELLVLSTAIVGAGLGFLWYNSYPAQVFMGDVGSLSLGGALGAISVFSKDELLLLVAGGIFVIEALSVIIQVVSYKTRKKRVFKMAPIHHHFELKGWPEPKVIVRFWIVSIGLALLSLVALKIR